MSIYVDSMTLQDKHIIPINLSDIREKVSESVRKIIISNNQLDESKKPAGYWTRERCYDEAKKYRTNKEFRKDNNSAYAISVRNGWIVDYTWFEELAKPKGYWTRETCYYEAKKYNSRAEFSRECATAYEVARKNGWLDDYTWFKKRIVSERKVYLVYCYEDKETNSVYVGLTNSLKRRHRQHSTGFLKHGKVLYDIVYKYFHSINKDIPDPIVLEKDLYANEAQIYEDLYIEHFKNAGLIVLNLAKAGSLGGYGKWDKDSCYKEAKKYKSKIEFRRGSYGAYQAASKNKWLDDYVWLEKQFGKWNEETCYKEAKKYQSRIEFQKAAKGAYKVAWQNGWLEDYTWLLKPEAHNKRWNRENCYDEAKKYKSRKEFREGNGSAYGVALTNKWLDDYTWFDAPRKHSFWNKETCHDEAKKYNSRGEFAEGSKGAYKVARINGWLNDYDWFSEPKTAKKWTRDTCYEEAKKYKSLSDFESNSAGAYNVARRNGWIDDYTWLIRSRKTNGYWDKDTCYNEAKKYNSRAEFSKGCGAAYNVAKDNGWLKDYTWFNKLWGKWSRETCYEEAKKYKTKAEFRSNAYGAYMAAYKNHWLDDYTWFLTRYEQKKWTRETCYDEAKKYNSRWDFGKNSSSAYQIAKKNGWLGDYTWFAAPKTHKKTNPQE